MIFKLNFNDLKILNYSDLINKFKFTSIYLIPSCTKIVIEVQKKKIIYHLSVNIQCFLYCFIIFYAKPKIKLILSKINFLLNNNQKKLKFFFNFSKKKIFFFLQYFFLKNWNNIKKSYKFFIDKKEKNCLLYLNVPSNLFFYDKILSFFQLSSINIKLLFYFQIYKLNLFFYSLSYFKNFFLFWKSNC